MITTLNNIHASSRSAASYIDDLSSQKNCLVKTTLINGQEYELALKTYEHEKALKKKESTISKIALYIGEFVFWRTHPEAPKKYKNYGSYFSFLAENLSHFKIIEKNLKIDVKTVKKEFIRLDREFNPKDKESPKRTHTTSKSVTFDFENVEKSDFKEQDDAKINMTVQALANDQAESNIKHFKTVGYITIAAVVAGVSLSALHL